MKNRTLYFIWAGLFFLCAALGFIPQPENLGKALLVLSAALFFVPPIFLTWRAAKTADLPGLRLLRNLSAASLIATLSTLVLNFLSITAPLWLGDLLYGLLVIVSVPMVCSRFWAGSLFLWACILFFCHSRLKKLSK